jgi:GTPase
LSITRGGGKDPASAKRIKKAQSFQGDVTEKGGDAMLAYVVHVEPKRAGGGSHGVRPVKNKVEEALGLTRAIGLKVVGHEAVPLAEPKPATLIGSGKVSEIATRVKELEAGLVVVNGQLSPIQQRNLEKAWNAKVLDRTGLILEIFGERASTKEGTLQVELAHLQYQKSRLVRSWTHLERQRGGFGFLGGPGESQIEADRRLIQERISRLERQLASVVKTRGLHRKGRARVPYPVVALVGYTNAGKSTLFNKLTSADVLAKDLLFATLDPTMRTLVLPHGRKVILSDTVGFISDLPTSLIAAFRATLEEVLEADVILHVRDASHEDTEAQAADVMKVLDQLGLEEERRSHVIEILNKADLLPPLEFAAAEAQVSRQPARVLVSAIDGKGLEHLLSLVEGKLGETAETYVVTVPIGDGKNLAWLHDRTEVLERKTNVDGSVRVKVRMDQDRAGQAEQLFGKAIRKERAKKKV